jgi:hypothetical protein
LTVEVEAEAGDGRKRYGWIWRRWGRKCGSDRLGWERQAQRGARLKKSRGWIKKKEAVGRPTRTQNKSLEIKSRS